MSLTLRQGLDSERQHIVFDEGEIVYTRDMREVWVGDGVTAGGVPIGHFDHDHDELYYGKNAVDVIIETLQPKAEFQSHVNNQAIHYEIDDINFSTNKTWSSQKIKSEILSHNHDTRYYQKYEINTIIDNLQDSLIRVSPNDTTSGYLSTKIAFGGGLMSEVLNSETGEVLSVSSAMFIANINGNNEVVFKDASRGDRILSASESILVFSKSKVRTDDWMNIGWATDQSTGFLTQRDSTIVGFSATVGDDNANTTQFKLYINEVYHSDLFQINGSGQTEYQSNSLIVDLQQGDKIQVRAGPTISRGIDNVTVQINIRWRASA